MKWMITLCLVAALGACDSDGSPAAGAADAQQEPDDPAAEACLHAVEGPFADVTASAEQAGAPDAFVEHTAVRIALQADAAGTYQGVVSIPVGEAGDYVVFLGADVPLALSDAQGTAFEVESSEPVEACTAIARQITVELPVGTAFLTFGPTASEQVVMVIEHAEAH